MQKASSRVKPPNTNDATGRSHLVLRIPEKTLIAGRRMRTVDLHNEAFKQAGSVLFAKFGASLVSNTTKRLRTQIANKYATKLIVVSKVGQAFSAHQAQLSSVFE